MNHPVKVCHSSKSIIMSCAFAKKASFPNTEEYQELEKLHSSFPMYSIIKRTIKKNSQKEAFNGLTYAYMESYIPNHDNAENVYCEYLKLRELARCHSIRYPHIKKWFLETYPEVKEFKLYKTENITNNNIEEKNKGEITNESF